LLDYYFGDVLMRSELELKSRMTESMKEYEIVEADS
jgi:hypothetical protein